MSPRASLSDVLACTVLTLFGAGPALDDKKYDPGVSDTEVKIGQSMPYSGPVSAISNLGLASAAYFDKVNAEGGVNGRKLRLISLDDGHNPAKTVEQTRRLVEQERVLLLFFAPGFTVAAPDAVYATK